jgi:hypothetical protein
MLIDVLLCYVGLPCEEWATRWVKKKKLVLLVIHEDGKRVDVVGVVKKDRENSSSQYALTDVTRVCTIEDIPKIIDEYHSKICKHAGVNGTFNKVRFCYVLLC